MIVIKDIEPKAKLHYLCIPKEHFALLSEMDDKKAELLKRCFEKIAALQEKLGLEEGYRIIVNQGQNGGRRKADGILIRIKFLFDRFCDIFVKILDNCVGKSV